MHWGDFIDINKLDNYFFVSAERQTFLGFKMTANLRDTSPLRTVLPFGTAHTFCAPWDGPRNLGSITVVPAETKNFCVVYNYAGKAGLGKSYWNLKRKLEVTTHFSEIIKLQFGKKIPYIVLYFNTF